MGEGVREQGSGREARPRSYDSPAACEHTRCVDDGEVTETLGVVVRVGRRHLVPAHLQKWSMTTSAYQPPALP